MYMLWLASLRSNGWSGKMDMYFISYVLIFSMFECATLYLSHVHVCSAKISLLWNNKQYRKITKFVVLRSMRSRPMFCLNWFLLEKFVFKLYFKLLICWNLIQIYSSLSHDKSGSIPRFLFSIQKPPLQANHYRINKIYYACLLCKHI